MTSAVVRLLAAVSVAVATATAVSDSHAQTARAPAALLDVPYLPQSEQLCGGAAVAMVMRYWGASGTYAETFAPLVSAAAGGIRGEDLLQSLRRRGWTAVSFRGDATLVQQQLSARRPVVTLVEDRPGQFHYVVVVGWASGHVIVHDPARAPFRVLDERRFLEAWRASDYWSLVTTPPAGVPSRPDPSTAPPTVDPDHAPNIAGRSVCDSMIEEGVRLAGSTDAAEARRLFDLAAATCPSSSAPHREIAGLYALHGEWPDAARSARRAVALDKDDTHAWRILATSLYLGGDDSGALAAWNRVGEPNIDLVNVHGLQRTRYQVAAGLMGLAPGSLLSPGALTAARRRLAELPSAQATRVRYRPSEGERAQLDAVVLERPVLPTSTASLAAVGLHAITDRELQVAVASPTGGGELWTVAWRWWEHRPRVGFTFDAPSTWGGVWGIGAFAERQTYAPADAPRLEERRASVDVHYGTWTLQGFRWEAGGGVDQWRGSGRAMRGSLSARQLFARDAGVASARLTTWTGGVRTWSLSLRSEWRSTDEPARDLWFARGGLELTGAGAPLDLWSGAGTGQGRDVLLRAHPLLDDGEGVVGRAVFGRRLLHGGVEWRRPLPPIRRVVKLAPAVFVDAARAVSGPLHFDGRAHIDLGAGLRLTVPGAGVLRIDLARGLRDGAMALSAGWTK